MRDIRRINDNWQFTKQGTVQTVNLPHTWNGEDGQDGGNDYYRGTCSYEKTLTAEDLPLGEEIWLQVDAANSSASVYLNDRLLAQHDGGYSAFRVQLTGLRRDNLLRIDVDNAENDHVYPQQADYTFYGGIYRDVTLIGVPRHHFDLAYHGAPGISVTTIPRGEDYEVQLQARCGGSVRFEIYDGEELVESATSSGTNPTASITIGNAHLWDGRRDPHLYTVVASLFDVHDNCIIDDQVRLRFGCRSYEIDPQKGFLLNGRSYPLRGVARHQDRPGIGNALLSEHHMEDMNLICAVGANSLRLAHYQHAQYFYDLCDERGILVWAEIPYISKNLPKGTENTKSQLTELICQCIHHPSICVWGLSNEITMGKPLSGIVENHRDLNDLAHRLDPTRPTTIAVFPACDVEEPYTHITDVIAYNQYFGWYGGSFESYGTWFDDYHKKYPDRAIGMSEYGCEALNWHSSAPVQGDYSEEYQALFHERILEQIMPRPWIWGTFTWNMFDFAADSRSEGGENGVNHKGLVNFDRTYKKDSFYIYQAWWSDEPMVHLCSKRYIDRVEDVVEIKVYSNQPEVELFANGVSVGVQARGDTPIFRFEVPNIGETRLIAKAGDLTDESFIRKVAVFNESYRYREAGTILNWYELTMPEGYLSLNSNVGDILATTRGKIFFLSSLRVTLGRLKSADSSKHKPAESGKDSAAPSASSEKTFSSDTARADSSVVDTTGERNEAASETVLQHSSTQGKSSLITKENIQAAMEMPLKRCITMLGDPYSREELIEMNAKLNKIRQPKKKS